MTVPERPRWVCLVTDRRRLAPSLDEARRLDALVELIGVAAGAGVDLVQIRERDLPARPLVGLVRRAVEAARDTHARIVVNDRVDVALAAGASGVHLRADSPGASRVRALAPPGWLIGRSVHSEAEAEQAVALGGVDYLVAGSVFPTSTKGAGHPVLGLEGLAAIVRCVSVPVLGIGGITLATASAVAEVGAGVAGIGLFLPGRGEEGMRAAARAVDQVKARLGRAAPRSGPAD